MKVDRHAKREVEEWQQVAAEDAADEEREEDERYRDGMETFERDFVIEKSEAHARISNQANCEWWSADMWRDAMLATHLFGEEDFVGQGELAFEYHRRQTDDLLGDPYLASL